VGDSGGDLLVFVGRAEWEGEEALPCTSRAILLLYILLDIAACHKLIDTTITTPNTTNDKVLSLRLM
jgi:hypothetical protein